MEKILYIKHADSSFILSDQHILEQQYRVVPFLFTGKKTGWHFATQMIRLSLFIIAHAHRSRALVTWFGDYHSALMTLMGKILGKKVIIFAGGQEAICYPELQKGVYYKKWRGRFVRFALKNATLIIPNHTSLIYHQNFYYTPDGKKDGISFYIPGIHTPMVVVPNGIDVDKYYRDTAIPKNPAGVLTVGTMSSNVDFLNKGFDLFAEMARRNADLHFTLIGIKKQFMPWIEENYHITSIPNLELIYSHCPDKVLFEQYNRATVYVQASITEGMPNTLNEAMLCECIPVGSNVNGIPDAIGETGIIVGKRDVAQLDQSVRKAFDLNSGPAARQHVLNNFTFLRREQNLLKLFSQYI